MFPYQERSLISAAIIRANLTPLLIFLLHWGFLLHPQKATKAIEDLKVHQGLLLHKSCWWEGQERRVHYAAPAQVLGTIPLRTPPPRTRQSYLFKLLSFALLAGPIPEGGGLDL